METRADEIAAGIYRVSVFLPEGAGGAGFTFNHFLILGDEPLLFHCGKRKMFPLVSEEVAKIIPLKKLRPAVRRKRVSSICRHCGLASMYPASDWSALCSGPSWISARMRSS